MILNTWTKARTWKSYDCYWARNSAQEEMFTSIWYYVNENDTNSYKIKNFKFWKTTINGLQIW